MLDNNDIQKLIKAQKEVFVTKEEFEGLIDIVATKTDLENFATKTDLNDVAKDVKEIKSLLIDFGGRTKKLETKVDYIENVLSIKQ
jgi:hypothetical protein